jgi:hypothetical protein
MASDERTGMVQVELSEDDVKQRSAKLASEELERETLLEKKRTHNRKWNEQLKQVGSSISVLAAEVDTGRAWVPAQQDIFGVDGSNDVAAAEIDPPARRRRGRRAAANGAEA